MGKLKILLNNETFSEATLKKVASKKTEKGALKALSTLSAFREAYPDSQSVFDKIFEARRMNSNDRCPCGSPISKFYDRIKGTYKYRCRACNLRISPLVDTPLKGSHIDLNVILEIAFRSFQSKHGLSAAEVSRFYGIKYETALSICHRIKIWMGLALNLIKFDNTTIEGDETYLRVPTGLPRGFKFSRGLGSERIRPVVTLVEQKGNAKGFVVDEVEKETIKSIYHQNVSLSTTVYTDGSLAYNFLSKDGYNHLECNHNKKQWAINGVHVNTAESLNALLKGNIGTVHKGVSSHHLQKYVDEVCFVFSNRYNDPYTAINSLFNALPPFSTKSK